MNSSTMQALEIVGNSQYFIYNFIFKWKFRADVPYKRTHFSEQSHNVGDTHPSSLSKHFL